MLSIVVPVFSEQESLKAFYSELIKFIRELDRSYEVIFVDDGSTDTSLELLKTIEKSDSRVRVISFRKNQGKAEALMFGFHKARGSVVVTLDADLQDKPSEIHKLLSELENGWDVVCGWRKNRKDTFRKVLSSKFFNLLARIFWGLRLHDYNCGLKVLSKDAAKSIQLYGGLHRFIPLLCFQEGFSVTEVVVSHQERKFGKSKYGLSKLWKDLPDIFTMIFLAKYKNRPQHFFGMVGGLLFTSGIIISLYLSILHFQGEAIGRRPLLFLGMLLIISGLQIFFTGFIADLIINVSHKGTEKISLKYSSE